MRSIKSSLTKLIKSVESKLPDENDLLDYDGISRSGIIETINTSYILLDDLEQRKETFEVTLLKRKLASLIRKASRFLNDQLGSLREKEDFNDFLDCVAEIKFQVKQCYLLVAEDCIRSEAAIIRAKKDLDGLNKLTEKYSELKDEISSSHETSQTNLNSINSMQEISEKSAMLISEYENSSLESHELIQSKEKDTEVWTGEIERISEEISLLNQVYKETLKDFNELSAQLEKAQEKIKEQQSGLAFQLENSAKQQADIKMIVGDANRASMAGSFRTRKDELDKPIRNSELLMNLTLIVIALISAYLLIDSGIGTSDFDYIEFFSRFTVIAPLIWIAWSSAKKTGHMVRIREDYAYKYASAMAYEGYRKQAEEIDENLLFRLLEVSIEHMGANPIRLFDSKNNHASPLHEVTNKVTDKVASTFQSGSNKKGDKEVKPDVDGS